MISIMPLPTWRQLFAALITKNIDDQELARPWLRENDYAFFFSRTAWSLKAIVLWWENFFYCSKPTIWIPDYFCEDAIIPLRQTSANLFFYPVDENMEPRWEICNQLASQNPPNIFVLVHYFGNPANAKKAKKFSQSYKSLLIEDAAHSLTPIPGIGEQGDFVLYSPYKTIAIPDGGICIMRSSHFKENQDKAIQIMQKSQQEIGASFPDAKNWVIKRIIRKLLPDKLDCLIKHYFFPKKLIYPSDENFQYRNTKNFCTTPQISLLARKLLKVNSKEINKFIEIRKEIFATWKIILSKQKNIRLKPHDRIIPYLAVFQVIDLEKSKSIFYELQNKNWPVQPWIASVCCLDSSHADYLQKTIITLPIHQTLSVKKLKRYFL